METVKITINGQEVAAPKGELLIEACEMNGIYLPRFCHFRGLTPQASCRMCVVRVDNPKLPKLQTACTMPVSDGMVVTTDSQEIEEVRSAMIEFLLSNHPVDCPVCDRAGECELQDQTYGFGEDRTRSQYADKENYLERQISPFMYNDPQRCVVCKRCTRVCEEWMDEFAITTVNRGSQTLISSFSGWVECSDCGNCVDVCPTGTLLHVPYKYVARPWDLKQTPTVCNFCSDGCSMLAGSRSEKLIRTVARDGRGRTAGGINHDFLCSLGRYTIDFVHSRQRVDRPMIRRGEHLIPATWDEALNHVAQRLGEIKAAHGGESIGVVSAGRLMNEDQFALRRFASETIGTNHADFYHDDDEIDFASFFRHGTPTIATQEHIQNAETILLIGSDPNEENPLTAFSIRWAVRQKAARLLIINSMPSRLERQAHEAIRIREGSESALIQALLDESKVSEAAVVMGVEADRIGAIRRALVESSKVVVIFGDELRGAAVETLAVFEEALATPNPEVAEAARKAHIDALQRAVRSSNSTQKPSINENPYTYIVEHPTLEVAAEAVTSATKFSFVPLVRYANSMGAWQMGLDSAQTGGLTAQAMINAAGASIRALYIAGEDVVSKANGNSAVVRSQLEKLDLLVVQEMFLTETAELADVVFPVTSFAEAQGTQVNNGSQVQFVRRTIPPVGQARPDWMVVTQVARLMGSDFGYQGQLKNVFREISEKVEGYGGLSHNLLANEGAIVITRALPETGRIDRADLRNRLAAQVASIVRGGEVDTSEMTAKAGSRLQKRYPLITRYSEMISPKLAEESALEAPAPVIFPA
ncbi:MAG: molybdopterin-dependent oxidoreductase [Acidobacteriota bacterium]|nr:MAG: molybdopterin-dependent oxidoreductase [Acidobacteriota bacterium]